jgi:hypothetical protein
MPLARASPRAVPAPAPLAARASRCLAPPAPPVARTASRHMRRGRRPLYEDRDAIPSSRERPPASAALRCCAPSFFFTRAPRPLRPPQACGVSWSATGSTLCVAYGRRDASGWCGGGRAFLATLTPAQPCLSHSRSRAWPCLGQRAHTSGHTSDHAHTRAAVSCELLAPTHGRTFATRTHARARTQVRRHRGAVRVEPL